MGFRGTEPLIADGDDLTVGKLIGLLEGGGGGSGGHLLLEVKGNIAELFLDVTDNLALSGGGERVTTLSEDLHEVVGELTASQVQTKDGVGKSITLIDGDIVGDTITRVHDHTGGTTRSVEGKDSLDGNIHSGHVEGLEHDLLHIIPVGDDTVFNGVFQGKDTPLGLSFISNIGILLTHTDHDTLVAGASNNGREDSPGGVISSETGFAHAGAIVNDKSGSIFVTHVCYLI